MSPGFCLIKKLVRFRELDLGGWLDVNSVDPDIVCFSASAGPPVNYCALLYHSRVLVPSNSSLQVSFQS